MIKITMRQEISMTISNQFNSIITIKYDNFEIYGNYYYIYIYYINEILSLLFERYKNYVFELPVNYIF